MGKDKSNQRTKGNVKPSSSGRSAELLGGVSSFVGFSGLDDLGYVPAATQATVDDDAQISAEFRIALRKMSKKDSVTKMKALQEFENLCSSEDIESVKTSLPYWPRLYSKLTFDCNRQVRESTQSAHSALVSQIGKNLAPYLRSVMPSWLLAMTDPHSPAATTASKSFQNAFSEEKRPGVMIFCSKEIIDFISDNLFIHSAQTLSDPKSTAKEDQDSKYIRVLFCSLKGLNLFLETTTKLSDKKGDIVAKMTPFLEQEIFWKLAKHESTLVRSAWYDTVKTFFEFDVEPLRSHIEKLSSNIFSALDSPEPIVLPHIWIAFLHLCVGLPECWDHCGNPKSVCNRIFSVLRDGGRGFMTELSPQLLPILSVIPVHMMEDPTAFYIDFFRAISTSLRKDKVLACKRDVSGIIVALNECMKYMSKEHGSNKELWDTLLKYQVVDLLRSSFEETPQLSDTQLYQEVGKLLLFWSGAADSKRDQFNMEKLDKFWDIFLPECESWILETNEVKISKLKKFYSIIKDPFSPPAKCSRGVRFTEDKDRDLITVKETLSFSCQNVSHMKNISTHISPLIKKCFQAFMKSKNDHVFDLFASFLFSYSSDQTYQEMVDHKVDDVVKAKMLFLEEHILPFMEEGEKVAPLETTIDLFLHVYAHLPEEQQHNLLMDLKPSLKVASLKTLIEKMTERIEYDSVAACWLKSPPLGGRMIKCLQHFCAITLTQNSLQSTTIKQQHQCLIDLLSFIFSNGHKNRTVFSLEYQSQMLKSLKTILLQLELKQASSSEDDCTTRFILTVTIFINHLLDSSIHSQVDGLEEMVKYFYSMLCYPLKASTETVLTEVKSCFFKAFQQNLKENMPENAEELFNNENGLLAYVLRETKTLIMSESCTFAKVLELSDLISSILVIMFKASPSAGDCSILLDHSIMQPTLERVLPTEYQWEQEEAKLSPLYVTPVVLFGKFICREFSLPLKANDTPPWHQGFIKASLFLIRVITTLCSFPPTPDGELPKVDLDEGSVSLGQFIPFFGFVIHGACHSSSMVRMNTYLNNDSVSSDIKLGNNKLSEDLRKLLGMINTGNKRLIVKNLRDRCSYGNSLWCVTLRHALNTWIKVPVDASKLLTGLNDNFLGYTETKQILIPFLPESSVMQILVEETKKLSRFSENPFSALPSVCLVTSVLEYLSRSIEKGEKVFSPEKVEAAVHTVFSVLVKWRDVASNIFLFASDLSGVPWEDVSMMVSIIRLLSVIVKGHSQYLLHSHWDVTLCALSAWVQSIAEVSQFPESVTVVAMFATVCSKCAGLVSELLLKLSSDTSRREEYPPTLVEEWQEFFAPSIYNTLLLKFIQCANMYEKERNVILFGLMRSLAVSVSCTGEAVLREINLAPLFDVSDSEGPTVLPDKLQFLLNHLAPLMLSRHPQSQCASYCLLKTSLPDVMAAWEKSALNLEEKEDLPQRPLPQALMTVIKEAGPVVETALIDKEIGCMCEILPYTDAYTFTAGYLLAWYLVLTAITYGEEKNQQLYASYIRESNMLWTLLNNLFKLMPLKPTLEKDTKQTPKPDATMFNTSVTISAAGEVSSEFISWMACQVYISCLTRLPAAVRNWWTNLDRSSQQIVDKFTTTYVSPILIANETSTMNESTVRFDNMTIKTRPGAREIIAVYTIDEASMELVLRMAPNHPLSTVNLEDHKRVGVSVAQWRNWLAGLNIMLSHRNTPLLNSLEFWKKNVDQKFQGIEECFICYYVLHGSNHQIPKLLCRTCKKKFHSACLYKWFSTSNNSTCPICRSLF